MKKLNLVILIFICSAFGLMAQQKVSSYLKPELVQYKKNFTMNGKKYTMYWVDPDKDINPTSMGVREIYLVPSDFKPINPANYLHDRNCPAVIEKLILHDIPGKEFLEAYVYEIKCDNNGYNQEGHSYGVRLPDEIADEIIELTAGNTKFSVNKMLTKYGSTTSEALSPLTVKKFSGGDRYN